VAVRRLCGLPSLSSCSVSRTTGCGGSRFPQQRVHVPAGFPFVDALTGHRDTTEGSAVPLLTAETTATDAGALAAAQALDMRISRRPSRHLVCEKRASGVGRAELD
jgi:hypothetical protein